MDLRKRRAFAAVRADGAAARQLLCPLAEGAKKSCNRCSVKLDAQIGLQNEKNPARVQGEDAGGKTFSVSCLRSKVKNAVVSITSDCFCFAQKVGTPKGRRVSAHPSRQSSMHLKLQNSPVLQAGEQELFFGQMHFKKCICSVDIICRRGGFR